MEMISRRTSLIASIVIDALGAFLIIAGAVIELVTSADIGFNLMSAGAITIIAGNILWAVVINKK
jgi:hypothetical protein